MSPSECPCGGVLEARVHALGLDEAASFGNAPGADRPHAELPHAAIGAGEQTRREADVLKVCTRFCL